jgi:predicted heme/steroid binding protein
VTFDGKNYDLYHCPNCDSGTVIARYGNDGSNYMSAMISVVERYPTDIEHPLKIAKKLIERK